MFHSNELNQYPTPRKKNDFLKWVTLREMIYNPNTTGI